MIVSVHQPHFLPWLGYLNKVLSSDVFVWLHDVQFRKNYFQNRTRVRGEHGQPQWLTVPVHAPHGCRIDEVRLADAASLARVGKTIEQCYRKAAAFGQVWPALQEDLARPTDSLEELNRRLFSSTLESLGSSVNVVRSGDLGPLPEDPTDRLVEICRAVGATRYLAGRGGHNYLRTEAFDAAGIRVLWQDFDPASAAYPQTGPGFVPGLSVLDCLLNVGPEEAGRRIREAWKPAA